MENNPNAFQRVPRIGNIYAGEGDLNAMMRVVGVTPDDFVKMTGIHRTTFLKWFGFPLHPWPVEFLRWVGRAKAMEKYLKAHGVDTAQFEPKLPTLLARQGRYPRKAGQEPKVTPNVNWSPWKP